MSKIISVDFDGVLCKNAYPDIGEPLEANMELIRRLKKKGYTIILNTCRTEPHLSEALEWLKPFKLPIDHVNINDPNQVNIYGEDCRKISADIYIDDKAYNPDPKALEKLIKEFIEEDNMSNSQKSNATDTTITTCFVQVLDTIDKLPCSGCVHEAVCAHKEKARKLAETLPEPFTLNCAHKKGNKITTPSVVPYYDYITTTKSTPAYCETCGFYNQREKKCTIEGKIMGITGLPCQQITCAN